MNIIKEGEVDGRVALTLMELAKEGIGVMKIQFSWWIKGDMDIGEIFTGHQEALESLGFTTRWEVVEIREGSSLYFGYFEPNGKLKMLGSRYFTRVL